LFLARGFPSSVQIFIASLPGLLGLNITQSPSSALSVCIQTPKIIINAKHVRRVNKSKRYSQLLTYSQVFLESRAMEINERRGDPPGAS
jgi:hypothetical protein